MTAACKAHKKTFEFDFADLEIKGRGSKGNILSKYPIRKVTQLEVGSSSLGAIKLWIDTVSGRVNKEERGKFLGKFDTGDLLVAVYKNGTYEITDIDQSKKYDPAKLVDLDKLYEDTVISCVYFEPDKGWTMVKRFEIETQTNDQAFKFISESSGAKMYYASVQQNPVVRFSYRKDKAKHEEVLDINEFVDIKGWKALGNKLGDYKILKIEDAGDHTDPDVEIITEKTETSTPKARPKTKAKATTKKSTGKSSAGKKKTTSKKGKGKDKLSPGDTIEFDF